MVSVWVERKRQRKSLNGAIDQGFAAMKSKLELIPESDVARVRAVRKAIGPKTKLGADANGGWTPEQALTTIRAII